MCVSLSPFAAQLIENQLDQLQMLGLDDSDRETIPDCEIYPHMMGELSDQVIVDGELGDGGGGTLTNKTDLDYYVLGAFSALNLSDLPLPIQVGGMEGGGLNALGMEVNCLSLLLLSLSRTIRI